MRITTRIAGLVLLAACGADAAPEAGVPVATAAHAGATQTAVVGAVVGTAPAVRVTDAVGRGVPGLSVQFVVVTGDGSVAEPATRTDDNGVARAGAWTLGPAVGLQTLAARFSGLPEVTFTATATAPPGQGALAPVPASDQQSAGTGATVPQPPSVTVRNASGIAQAGITVTFAVTAGGGTLAATTAVSSAQGVATAGAWRLGPTPGRHTVRATATGFVAATVSATAVDATAPVLDRTVIVSGLAAPWDIAFAPDGAMLFTERSGRVRVLPAGSTTPRTLVQPSDIGAAGQSGMLGLTLDPAFATNRFVYTFQSFRAGNGAMDNRVVRWTADAAWTVLGNRTDLVTGIPWGNGGAHSGGRLRFGTDGLLYVTSGDNRLGPIPQDLAGLGSKVLRITRDGTPAPANGTFPRTADPRIFAFGFRNPQGLAVRESGQVFTCEHGPVHRDEVTLLAAGGNGGWDPMNPGDPTYRGYDGQWPMTDSTKFPQALRPTWTTGNVSEGMAGCAFVRGTAWRGWDGALVVALLAGRRVQVLQLTPDGRGVTLQARALEFGERLRSVTQGPDGALYVATDGKSGGDEIWRVAPRP
jgi:glucose/arabinose dehydrogenase